MRRRCGVALSAALLAVIVVIAAACGKPTPPPGPSAPPASTVAAPEASANAAPSTGDAEIVANVRAVDADGHPIAGMMPIATTEPSAFTEPVARGPLTNAEGRSELRLPTNQWLYVRTWDPEQRRFANNYFDVPPGEGNTMPLLEVVMLEAGRVQAALRRADGSPFVGITAGLLLIHPTAGPWWPTETQTAAMGLVTFGPCPAGKYIVRLKTESGESIELPDVIILPGRTTDLGEQTLE